jgi:hypothetical protein
VKVAWIALSSMAFCPRVNGVPALLAPLGRPWWNALDGHAQRRLLQCGGAEGVGSHVDGRRGTLVADQGRELEHDALQQGGPQVCGHCHSS